MINWEVVGGERRLTVIQLKFPISVCYNFVGRIIWNSKE
jgi:hypothetical protein